MEAKIKNIMDKLAKELLEYVVNSKGLDSYSFESGFNEILTKTGDLKVIRYQALFRSHKYIIVLFWLN